MASGVIRAQRKGPAASLRAVFLLALIPLLAGCLLIAGGQQSADRAEDGGNVSVQFVSAEGTEVRQVKAADAAATLKVTVFARVERGQLRIEVLDPQNSIVKVIDAQPSEQIDTANVATNEAGEFRYRIRATGAQNGQFQILYQPIG